jgi:hypothetical protein
MLFYFLFTVIFSIFASIAAASFLWRAYAKPIYGFIPVLMMAILGILMMSIFHTLLISMDTETAVILVYTSANVFVLVELFVCILLDRKQRNMMSKKTQ